MAPRTRDDALRSALRAMKAMGDGGGLVVFAHESTNYRVKLSCPPDWAKPVIEEELGSRPWDSESAGDTVEEPQAQADGAEEQQAAARQDESEFENPAEDLVKETYSGCTYEFDPDSSAADGWTQTYTVYYNGTKVRAVCEFVRDPGQEDASRAEATGHFELHEEE